MTKAILPPASETADIRIPALLLPTRTDMDPVALFILDCKAAADTRKRLKGK